MSWHPKVKKTRQDELKVKAKKEKKAPAFDARLEVIELKISVLEGKKQGVA